MIRIRLEEGDMACEVLPEYGGMVARLWMGDRQVLRMDEGLLGVANVLSGGIPLLFPFAGRCPDGAITLGRRSHFMPMHGFAKDLPFAVLDKGPQACALGLDVKRAPYDLYLTLKYRLAGGALHTTAHVANRGDGPVPLALGFHPYFRVGDRAAASLTTQMTRYWDYLQRPPVQGALSGPVDLQRDWDHVLLGDGVDARLACPAEGYAARVWGDESFKVLTLCTTQPGAVCVEPWQAPPDALGGGLALWLAPGAARSFSYAIALTRL